MRHSLKHRHATVIFQVQPDLILTHSRVDDEFLDMIKECSASEEEGQRMAF
jgi:hypothetical protein